MHPALRMILRMYNQLSSIERGGRSHTHTQQLIEQRMHAWHRQNSDRFSEIWLKGNPFKFIDILGLITHNSVCGFGSTTAGTD